MIQFQSLQIQKLYSFREVGFLFSIKFKQCVMSFLFQFICFLKCRFGGERRKKERDGENASKSCINPVNLLYNQDEQFQHLACVFPTMTRICCSSSGEAFNSSVAYLAIKIENRQKQISCHTVMIMKAHKNCYWQKFAYKYIMRIITICPFLWIPPIINIHICVVRQCPSIFFRSSIITYLISKEGSMH